MNFKDMPPILVVLNEGVDLLILITVAGEHSLNRLVVKEVLLGHTKDLKGLLFGHKAALNSKAFVCNFFSEFVGVLFGLFSTILLFPEVSNFCQSFLRFELNLLGGCLVGLVMINAESVSRYDFWAWSA